MSDCARIFGAAAAVWLLAFNALHAGSWLDYGVDPYDVEGFANEANARDFAAAFRLIDRLNAIPPNVALALSGESGVSLRRIEGALVEWSRLEAAPNDDAEPSDRELYLVVVEQGSGDLTTVYVGAIPSAWRLDPARGVGQRVFTDAIGATSECIAPRLGWLPDSPLGEIGFDAGLLDDIADRKRLTGEDAPAFYGLLAAVGRLDAAIKRQAKPANIPALFNRPAKERGKLVRLAGVARRVMRVAMDPSTAARYGFDHYYEVDLFPLESQNNPVVVCVRELPAELGEGSNLRVSVACDAFFLKSWAFRPRIQAITTRDSDENPRLQLAPLLIAKTVAAAERADEPPQSSFGWLVVLLGAAACAAVLLAAWPRKGRSRAPSQADLAFLNDEEAPASGSSSPQ